MAEPTAADRAWTAHDHGNCELCDWIEARVEALEAERAQACARVVELELLLDRYLDPKQWDIWP